MTLIDTQQVIHVRCYRPASREHQRKRPEVAALLHSLRQRPPVKVFSVTGAGNGCTSAIDMLETPGGAAVPPEVYEAADGPAGVAQVVDRRPEVALVDLGLPGLDGYEVARRIRTACGGSVYIVALTGYDLADYRRRSREAGFDDHLVKPVAPDVLRRVLGASRGASDG